VQDLEKCRNYRIIKESCTGEPDGILLNTELSKSSFVLVSYHCEQIPEINNLKGGKVILAQGFS
jgi:hypothetical protein